MVSSFTPRWTWIGKLWRHWRWFSLVDFAFLVHSVLGLILIKNETVETFKLKKDDRNCPLRYFHNLWESPYQVFQIVYFLLLTSLAKNPSSELLRKASNSDSAPAMKTTILCAARLWNMSQQRTNESFFFGKLFWIRMLVCVSPEGLEILELHERCSQAHMINQIDKIDHDFLWTKSLYHVSLWQDSIFSSFYLLALLDWCRYIFDSDNTAKILPPSKLAGIGSL